MAEFLVLLLVCGAIAFFLKRAMRDKANPTRRDADASHRRADPPQYITPVAKRSMADPAVQIEAVEKVGFVTQALLNKSEARLLPIIEDCARAKGRKYRVMAQTSLGEIIRPQASSGSQAERDEAYAAINSKRVDFAIIDPFGTVMVVIEYQGHGHYGRQSFMRDAVKREALRKAGVPMIEVPAEPQLDLLRLQLLRLLGVVTPETTPAGV